MNYSLKDKTMLRIAMITTIFGLISLFSIMFFKTEKLVSIKNIDAYTEQTVSLKGKIINLSYTKNNTKFILIQECGVEVIAFNNYFNSSIDTSKVVVTGKVHEYKGRNSIIADKIVEVN